MSWVIGIAYPFGYGALIADVRVQWQNGRHLDVLQKIYPVGESLIAGFAGSVEIGFELIGDMTRSLALPEGHMWEPKAAAWHWRRRGRFIFRKALKELQDLGASVLLVGPSPERNGPWTHVRCIRMRAPAFELEIAPVLTGYSIGSGSTHRRAEDFGSGYRQRFFDGLMKSEVQNHGGSAFTTADTLASTLEDEPMSCVSSTIHLGIVSPMRKELSYVEREHLGVAWHSAVRSTIPDCIVSSWKQFQVVCGSHGLRAAQASI